jgi:chemotaxis protein methyltransferase CheR
VLALFKELILNTCGFSLEMGREQTLINAVRERMVLRGLDAAADYHALLIRDGRELGGLVELLTVNETYFFREPGHLSVAADKLLPECLSRSAGKPVRILSAGCSTGEEPYTLAMMLRERYGADSQRLFAITGVDIDSGAIAGARLGVYGRSSFRHMDQGVLERYFEPAGPAEFRVREGIRKLVDFEVVNLLEPSYPQGMREPDLIFYRNVSIYFPQQVQQKIFTRLAGVLKCGGYLIVGASETIHHNTGILSLAECDSLFFYHKSGAAFFKERRVSGQDAPVYERRQQAKPVPLSLKPRPDRTGTDAGGNRPEQEGHLFDTALGLARSGQGEKALQLLADIIEREPSFAKPLMLKGSLLLSAARYDEALEVCHRILALDPLCLEACLMLGMIARHRGKNDDAFRHFREAVYLDASCWLAHFYSAEILFAQGDAKRARTGYETASRLLGKGGADAHGQAVFQLSFNAEQFIVICQHKLSLLKETR